jgi:hypothetical protein
MTHIDLSLKKGISGTISCPELKDLINVLNILYKRNPDSKVGINTFDSQLCIFDKSDDGYGDTITLPSIN